MGMINAAIQCFYHAIQFLIACVFAPPPPPTGRSLPNAPRIAIVGAALTGVSSAAHAVGHGFEVTIFESGSRENLGGIWSRVNNTSSLQIYSIMYRFFPSVNFRAKYPDRNRILEEITKIWKQYHLDDRTLFDTKVEKVWQHKDSGKWVVNDESHGLYDGVVAAIGTCGPPKTIKISNQDKFQGEVCHSSDLTGKAVKGKRVLVVGSGASAVEAIEYAVDRGAKSSTVLARSQKWIIPRNPLVDTLLAANITSEGTMLSWIPERLLKRFFYRDLKDLAPENVGLYTETPVCNDAILKHIRNGKVQWLQGDLRRFTDSGIVFYERGPHSRKEGPGREIVLEGDLVILATGFHRPSLHFLPEDSFAAPYQPPNWYLQTFPVGHPDICATNCTYLGAIGTVGNVHIGIYTRYLLMFVADPATKPSPAWMRAWVDWSRAFRSHLSGQGLDFFTYAELIWWFVFGMLCFPTRWKWIPFVLFGWGGYVSGSTGGGGREGKNKVSSVK